MKKILGLILSILLICGCSNEVIDNDQNDNLEENKTPITESVKVVDVNSKTRPVAVMINNHKTAQKVQTGLNDAYLVYEFIVEGGITRMMSLFKDADTAKIGTIRSSRHYYLDYARENDAIYVHFGWSEPAREAISKLGINNINGLYDSGFWRDNPEKLPTEHTVYTSMKNINKNIQNKKYRTTTDKDLLLNYSAKEIDLSTMEDSIKADDIKIVYSDYQTNNFVYDKDKKVYNKVVDGVIRKDYVTKEAFETKNIITYQVKNYSLDGYLQELDNVGSGKGYFISNGYAVPITWEKKSQDSQTVYKYLNGEEITVNDGITYIQVQPLNKTLEIK